MDTVTVVKGSAYRSLDKVETIAGAIPADVLLKYQKIPRFEANSPNNGYQRNPSMARINSLTNELCKGNVDIPTSVLLNFRGDAKTVLKKMDDGTYRFNLNPKKAGDDHTLYVVDGQHRILALEQAITREPKLLSGYKIFFVCMLGATFDQELKQFHIVNSTAKSVRTDLAWQLMKERSMKEDGYFKKLVGARKEWRIETQRLVEHLSNHSIIWKGRIQMPNMLSHGTTVPSSGLALSLKVVYDQTPLFHMMTIENLHQVVDAYWSAIRRIYPEAFEKFSEYNLLGSIGASTMHSVFPIAYEMVRNEGGSIYNAEDYLEHLKNPLESLSDINGNGENVDGINFWKKGKMGAAATYSSLSGRSVLTKKLMYLFPTVDMR